MKKWPAAVLAVLFAFVPAIPALGSDAFVSRLSAVEQIIDAMYDTAGTDFKIDDYYHTNTNGSVRFTPDNALNAKGFPALCGAFSDVPDPGFSDVVQSDNGYTKIALAKAVGIVYGYPDGSFQPDKPITYIEAVTMLCRALGFSGEFYTDSYADTIETAEDSGILNGVTVKAGAVSIDDFSTMLKNCDGFYGPNHVLCVKFTPPATAEQCAADYAEAVKGRNGALEFALYDDGLKDEKWGGFIGQWVTGVSSPWVDSYTVKMTDDTHAIVSFLYADNSSDQYTESVTLTIQENGGSPGYYYITDIE